MEQQSLEGVQAILCLVEYSTAGMVDDAVGDLLAAVRRQAVQEDGVLGRQTEQGLVDPVGEEPGAAIGRHKLFPRVSPNKTWEGAVAGFVFAILSALAARALVLDYLGVGDALVLGGIVGTFGQLGDLFESSLKRDAGVKDSSNLLPGHGGVLDRFDSLLFVAPLAYLYIDYIILS